MPLPNGSLQSNTAKRFIETALNGIELRCRHVTMGLPISPVGSPMRRGALIGVDYDWSD
jgi:hypothetical protein